MGGINYSYALEFEPGATGKKSLKYAEVVVGPGGIEVYACGNSR